MFSLRNLILFVKATQHTWHGATKLPAAMSNTPIAVKPLPHKSGRQLIESGVSVSGIVGFRTQLRQ